MEADRTVHWYISLHHPAAFFELIAASSAVESVELGREMQRRLRPFDGGRRRAVPGGGTRWIAHCSPPWTSHSDEERQ